MTLHSKIAFRIQYHSNWLPSKANTNQSNRTDKY